VRKFLIQQNKSSLVPWESNNWYWACWPTQPQNERDSHSHRSRNKLQLHKHFYNFCRHPNSQEQYNNSRKCNVENCSTIRSFNIYYLWYPPRDTARPFMAYFSGFSWHHKNIGNDSHKAGPERSKFNLHLQRQPILNQRGMTATHPQHWCMITIQHAILWQETPSLFQSFLIASNYYTSLRLL